MTLLSCESSCYLVLLPFSRDVSCHDTYHCLLVVQEVQVCELPLALQKQGLTRPASPSCSPREVTQLLLRSVFASSFAPSVCLPWLQGWYQCGSRSTCTLCLSVRHVGSRLLIT